MYIYMAEEKLLFQCCTEKYLSVQREKSKKKRVMNWNI